MNLYVAVVGSSVLKCTYVNRIRQGCIKFPIPPPGGGYRIKLLGKKIKWGRRKGEGKKGREEGKERMEGERKGRGSNEGKSGREGKK